LADDTSGDQIVAPTPDVVRWARLPGAAPLAPGTRALAAVSGGPDSTALLVWLLESQVDVTAAHFDHALRADSALDAQHVAGLCSQLGVSLIQGRRARQLPPGSLQAGARALRYEFLERVRHETGCGVVCLGHTADDVVEGAVMHLLRGSALAGLRGMPQRRGGFFRPFLNVWRADIEAYLHVRGIDALRDPSNADTSRFARARARHVLLPRLEQDRPGLSRRLRAAAETAARLQDQLEAGAQGLIHDGVAFRRELREAPRAVRLEVYRQLHGRLPALSRRQLEAIDALALSGATGTGLDLPGRLRLHVQPDRVSVDVACPPRPAPPRLAVRACRGCADPGAAHLRPGMDLTVGYRRPGLRLRPLGAPGSRKLQDVLTDAKVPRHLRDRLPLVFADGRLAWVPGIAVDRDCAASRGGVALHVTIELGPEFPVVLSSSLQPRSLAT